ncbi:hypothetical protein ACQEU6_02370 [Spirillospora sp. CA-108201]
MVTLTLEQTPSGATPWSKALRAGRTGLPRSTIGRIWRRSDLKPHRADAFKISTDRLLVEKVVGVVGLYHHPPEWTVVLCVDEKSQMQALDRSQLVLPLMPGAPSGAPTTTPGTDHQPVRHLQHRRRHRHHRPAPPESRGRVQKVPGRDRQGRARRVGGAPGLREPGHPQNTARPSTAGPPPRFHVHFTPSFWLNQVERWFAYLTAQLTERGVHKSVQALEADVRAWGQQWNTNPKPFVLTKTAEEILDSLARYLQRISDAER